jgi:hypothetical protein
MRFLSYFAVLLFVMTASSSVVRAEDSKETPPWAESCRHYHASRQFVSESTLYCMRQRDQKGCRSLAQRYFERCGFSGDYQKMSARMGARMLLVLALSSVRSVHHIDL